MSIHTIATVLSRAAERRADGRTYAGALVTIDKTHHEIHEGENYFVTASTANASATAVLGVVLTTPTTKRIHYDGAYGGSGAIVATLIENPTVAVTSKVALVEFNSDRDSTKAATVVAVTISDTDVSGGTTLQKQVLGGGLQGRNGFPGSDRKEIMLKQSEDYYIKIESDAASNNVSYLGTWYEESS